MGWANFQRRLLKKMQKGPSSYEEVAKLIVSEYEKAVKDPASGDKTARNRLLKGNKAALEKYLISIFKTQSKSTVPLDMPNLIAKGFVIYWTGGQMSTEKVPVIPSPGAIFNINVVQNTITNPGAPVPIPFPLGKSQTTEQWINNLIRLLKSQLLSVSGQATLTSAYPQPLPPGFFPAPGISIWTGYDIIDDRTKEQQNPAQYDSQDDDIESEQNEFEKFLKENGPIISVDKIIKQKVTQVISDLFTPSPAPPRTSSSGGGRSIFSPTQTSLPASTLSTIENNLSPVVYKNAGAVFAGAPADFRGKYENAKIPLNKLVGVEKGSRPRYTYNGSGGWMLLHPEAAEQYLKWKKEAVAAGVRWSISSAYRDLEHQIELSGNKSLQAGTVAKPGTSPHGWAVALDFGDLYQVVGGSGNPAINAKGRETSALYRWMCNSGAKYGWFNPFRLCDGAGLDEMWHWEYHFGTAKV